MVARGPVVALTLATALGGAALARDRRRVAAARGPYMLGLTVVTAGRAELDIDGGAVELGAGDVCLLASPVEFHKRVGAGYAETFLYCPLTVAEAALGRPTPALTLGRAARGPLTEILADTVVSVGRHAHRLTDAEWAPLLGSILGLAAAAFGPPAGRDPDELASAANKIQAGDCNPILQGLSIQGAPIEGAVCTFLLPYWSMGKNFNDATGKMTLDKDAAAKGMDMWLRLVDQGVIKKNVAEVKTPDTVNEFKAGQVAFAINWGFAWDLF